MDNVSKVAKWRNSTKSRLVEGFGGCCNKCGYDKCSRALDLHHLDPSKKSFGFGQVMANPKRWDLLVEEAKKCILLCGNCHDELHSGLWAIEEIEIVEFKEEKRTFKKEQPTGKCPVCDKDVYMERICCGRACAALRANKITWPCKDELKQMLETYSRTKVATILGVSDAAVKKREIKLGID